MLSSNAVTHESLDACGNQKSSWEKMEVWEAVHLVLNAMSLFLQDSCCTSCMTVHILWMEKKISLFLLVKVKTELTVTPVLAIKDRHSTICVLFSVTIVSVCALVTYGMEQYDHSM